MLVDGEDGGGEGDCKGCGDAPQNALGGTQGRRRVCVSMSSLLEFLKGPPFEPNSQSSISYNICGRTKFLNRSVGNLGGNAAGPLFAPHLTRAI